MITAVKTNNTTTLFDDKLLLFSSDNKIPFAYRAPAAETQPYKFTEEKVIDKIGQFEISASDKHVICKYIGTPAGCAVIEPLEANTNLYEKSELFINYLRTAYSLELSARGAERLEYLTAQTAEKCGCLTDIYRENDIRFLPMNNSTARPDSAFIAISLPIIALMYRRISALRGFNFKIAFSGGIPCLVFSAKVILRDKSSDIPECRALSKVTGSDDLAFIHQITELDEICDSGKLFKLSLAICPQTADPKGILRAPEWKKHTETILSKIDLDVPGRF